MGATNYWKPLSLIFCRPSIRSQKRPTKPKNRTNSTKEFSEQFGGGYRSLPSKTKGFEANRTRKFTRTFGKIFVTQFVCGTFSVPKSTPDPKTRPSHVRTTSEPHLNPHPNHIRTTSEPHPNHIQTLQTEIYPVQNLSLEMP